MTNLPTGRIEWLVDRVSVATPSAELAADIARRCSGPGWTPALVRAAVRHALARHEANRQMYRDVMR